MSDDIFTLNGKKSLTIVLDRTASMKETIQALLDFLPMYVIRRCAADLDQMSLVTFDDHYTRPRPEFGQTITPYGPTENLEEYVYWLKTVEIGDGQDYPEAIACALAKAREIDPDASIWLVTDAVPHGAGGRNEQERYERYWGDAFHAGCPCGTRLDTDGVSVAFVKADGYQAYVDEFLGWWTNRLPGRVVVVDDLAGKLQEPVKVEA